MPYSSPDGLQLDLFGPPPAPASLSARPGSAKAPATNGTSGLPSVISSASAVLQRSLASRLEARLDVHGSLEYSLTWKVWAMQSREPICALRASGCRTSDNDCTGWPTPNVPNGGRSITHAEMRGATAYHNGKKVQVGLEAVARMAGWSTPASLDWRDGRASQKTMDGNARPINEQAVNLAGWGTPRSVDAGHSTGNPDRAMDRKARIEDQVYLVGWGTPSATERSGQGETNVSLMQQARLAGWPTPNAIGDTTGGGSASLALKRSRLEKRKSGASICSKLRDTAMLAGPCRLGTTTTSSTASTAKPGALNPDFTRWLMGFPPAWASCAPTAMPSSRKSRRSL